MKIMITGPQGSGKTTIAKALSEKMDLCLIKTGDLVRDKALEDSKIGRSLKKSLEEGVLSDDNMVGQLVAEELEKEYCVRGIVVDGYPRRLSQLQVFDPQFDRVFLLQVPEEVLMDRMLKRGRMDDIPELIRQRLHIYEKETGQVIDYYKNTGILKEVDGESGVEEVVEEIMEDLNEK